MYYFIVNPASRTGMGLQVWKQAEQELKQHTTEYQVYFTKYPRHSIRLTKELCARVQGEFTLTVLGGDGTANEVLSAIPEQDLSRITFAYLPSGSSNDLARGLGISQDPAVVIRAILSGEYTIKMDYGNIFLPEKSAKSIKSVSDALKPPQNTPESSLYWKKPHRFAVSAGIGFDAAVCKEALDSPVKKALNRIKLGKLSYLVIALKQVITCRTADLTISIDGGPPVPYQRVFFAAAMNQRFEGGGLPVAPNADPTDHLLSLCVIHNFPKIKAVLIIPALVLGGRHTRFKGVTLINCRRAEIQASEPLCVHSDGEYRGFHEHLLFSCSDDPIRMVAGEIQNTQ